MTSGLLAGLLFAAGCAHGPLSRDAWYRRGSLAAPLPETLVGSNELPKDELHSARQAERRKAAIRQNLERGNAEAAAGRPEQAARFYERVIRDEPRHAVAQHRLGIIADQAGDHSAAERHYLAALETEPRNVDVLADLGHSYLLQRRYADSERVLRAAIAVDPGHAAALSSLAALDAGDDGERASPSLYLVAADAQSGTPPSAEVEPRIVPTSSVAVARRPGLIEPPGRSASFPQSSSSALPAAGSFAASAPKQSHEAEPPNEPSSPGGLPFWTPAAAMPEASAVTRKLMPLTAAAAANQDTTSPPASATSGAVSDLFAKPVPAAMAGYSAANVVP